MVATPDSATIAAQPEAQGRDPSLSVQPGTLIASRYEILRTIGAGGMGDVHQARRVADGSFVAIKVLREEMVKDPEALARFRREAHAAAALKSRHAARIYDVGELPSGQPFIVMEYLDGIDLMTEIETRGRVSFVEGATWLLEVCDAIAEAHELGIIHRDLKPPNIFLARGPGGRSAKVLDFGISKMTRLVDGHVTSTQMSFGSPLYMSPEQIRSTKLVDTRSDIWSLGVILYEALTGVPPFFAESAGALAVVISTDPFEPATMRCPDLPRGLDEVFARALTKDPNRRYPTVRELARDLGALLASTSRSPVQPTVPALDPAMADTLLHASPLTDDAVEATLRARAQQAQAQQAQALDARSSAISAAPPSPPRSSLGPAMSLPPPAAARRQERIGILVAAVLIPLGALAFGAAIWLYAKTTRARAAHEQRDAAAAITSVSIEATPSATQQPVLTATVAQTAGATASASVKPSASIKPSASAKPSTRTKRRGR